MTVFGIRLRIRDGAGSQFISGLEEICPSRVGDHPGKYSRVFGNSDLPGGGKSVL